LFYLPFDNDFWAKICLDFHSTAVLFFRRPRQFVVEPIPPSTSRLPSLLHCIFFFGAIFALEIGAIQPFEGSIRSLHLVRIGSVHPSIFSFAYIELSLNSTLCWTLWFYDIKNWTEHSDPIGRNVTNIFVGEFQLHKIPEPGWKPVVTRADEVKISLSTVSCTKNMAPDFYSLNVRYLMKMTRSTMPRRNF
jgi:hypothetical protein